MYCVSLQSILEDTRLFFTSGMEMLFSFHISRVSLYIFENESSSFLRDSKDSFNEFTRETAVIRFKFELCKAILTFKIRVKSQWV